MYNFRWHFCCLHFLMWLFYGELFAVSQSHTVGPSSETQGQSVGPGEKARWKFSSTGGRAPGYRLSPDHFQTVKWMLAPDWAQKMLFIIVPNRRTASPEFFSWVRISRHSCPLHLPSLCVQGKLSFSTFLTRNEGTTDESKKHCDAISRSNWICPENILFLTDQIDNRKFKTRRRRESQISNSFTRQNKNFARASRFFAHFFAVNCTTTQCLISCFVKDVNKKWQNFLSLYELGYGW